MRRRTTRAVSRIAAAWLGCAALAAPAGASVPTLYHSPTGNDPGSVVPLFQWDEGPHTLALYLKPGGVVTNNGGALCNAGAGGTGGNGDETCGVHLEISVDGDLSILSFTPAVGQASSKIEEPPRRVRAALVTTAAPLSAQPTLVGTLVVASGPAGGTVQLAKLDTVDASLDLEAGAPRSLARVIPEPEHALQLAAGVLALVWLARRRARCGGDR